jgi:hypothetical protein
MLSASTVDTRPAPTHRRAVATWLCRHPLAAYFTLAFLGTWLIIVPMALGQGEHGLGVLPFEVPSGLDFLLV